MHTQGVSAAVVKSALVPHVDGAKASAGTRPLPVALGPNAVAGAPTGVYDCSGSPILVGRCVHVLCIRSASVCLHIRIRTYVHIHICRMLA